MRLRTAVVATVAALAIPVGVAVIAGTPSAAATEVSATTIAVPLTAGSSGNLAIPPSTVVGLSWSGSAEPGTRVFVAVREAGAWGKAHALSVAGTSAGRTSIEPLVARSATGVRVRITTPSGHSPRDVRLVAVPSRANATDSATVGSGAADGSVLRAAVAAPTIITRAQWGADEKRRTRVPSLSTTIKVGVLHHTTGWSSYTGAEAYQFIRALYEWYTTPAAQGGPGVGDIAYNLLVDRFGRVFEGAAGGVTKPVTSAHVVGFSKDTVSVAAMGDFDVNPVSDAMVTSIAKVMAWKLAPFNRNPGASEVLTADATGSRFRVGQAATVPVISPHAALAVTTSPGHSLADRLNQIRALSASLMGLPAPAPTFGTLSSTPVSVAYRATTGATVSPMTTRPMNWIARVYSPCVDASVRVLRGKQNFAGPMPIVWDLRDSVGIPVTPGLFTVSITGTTVDTNEAAPAIDAFVRVTAAGTSGPGPCPTVSRTTGSTSARAAIAIGRWSEPHAGAAVLVPDGAVSDIGYQQVAAPLARSRHLPMLTVGTGLVSTATMGELEARGVKTVIIVGPPARVGASVVSQLAAKGITAWRVWGIDLPSTAAAVARVLAAPGTRGAVFIDPVAHPAESALAAAAAARTGRPVLVLSAKKIPAATAAIVAERRISAGAVVASATTASDALVSTLKSTRIWNADYSTLSLALAGSAATTGERAILVPVRSVKEATLAASAGRPLLPLGTATLSTPVSDWLETRPQLVELAVAVPGTVANDDALATIARWMDARPTAPFTLAAVGHRGASAVPTPQSFTVNGSGWGHGIGLSQAGAHGQAKEGRTAEQIVTHYYTGTQVTPVDDTMEMAVALLHRVPRAYLRSQPTKPGATGAVKLTFSDGTFVVGTSADTFGFRMRRGLVVVSRSTNDISVDIATTRSVRVTWAGTRDAGSLGKRLTLMNVVGPGDAFTDKQHRYRYGSIVVRPISGTSSNPAGLMVINSVRLHDEYLYGIAEVNASWPLAALQSQIMASRSYAYAQWKNGLRSSCLCHSDDGGGPYYDQTFLGWVKVDEGPYSAAWRAAVDTTAVNATQGKAITYQGTVITAYYTDSTGGRTRNNEDVWGDAPEPWARGVDDHWSLDPANSRSFAQWRPRVRTQAEVATAFGLPDVVSVEVVQRQSSGTALVVTATSSMGATASISGASLRRQLGLPSLWVWTVVANP